MADKTLILISGMPATGKSTFAGWLAKRLRAPLVSYDRLLDQVCRIIDASGADPTAALAMRAMPYELFLFELEEHLATCGLTVAEYIFSTKMTGLLEELTEQYGVKALNIHFDCDPQTAYRRYTQRNALLPGTKTRPDVSWEDFLKGTEQNRAFRFGTRVLEVAGEDLEAVSYQEILAKLEACL